MVLQKSMVREVAIMGEKKSQELENPKLVEQVEGENYSEPSAEIVNVFIGETNLNTRERSEKQRTASMIFILLHWGSMIVVY